MDTVGVTVVPWREISQRKAWEGFEVDSIEGGRLGVPERGARV